MFWIRVVPALLLYIFPLLPNCNIPENVFHSLTNDVHERIIVSQVFKIAVSFHLLSVHPVFCLVFCTWYGRLKLRFLSIKCSFYNQRLWEIWYNRFLSGHRWIKSVIYLEMIVQIVICKVIRTITQISTAIQFSVATDPIRLYNRIVQCWRWFVVCKC